MPRSVKVHDDTHEALKRLKEERRCRSIDEVVRQMIRESTGSPVGRPRRRGEAPLTSFKS